jgi:hypothetical protein
MAAGTAALRIRRGSAALRGSAMEQAPVVGVFSSPANQSVVDAAGNEIFSLRTHGLSDILAASGRTRRTVGDCFSARM